MTYTVRITLETYNALTDTNISHFSLYADSDNVLIKEKVRGSTSITNAGNFTLAHGLGYVPLIKAFAEVSAGKWVKVLGDAADYDCRLDVDATNMILRNNLGGTKTFKYYIFYDQQV